MPLKWWRMEVFWGVEVRFIDVSRSLTLRWFVWWRWFSCSSFRWRDIHRLRYLVLSPTALRVEAKTHLKLYEWLKLMENFDHLNDDHRAEERYVARQRRQLQLRERHWSTARVIVHKTGVHSYTNAVLLWFRSPSLSFCISWFPGRVPSLTHSQ